MGPGLPEMASRTALSHASIRKVKFGAHREVNETPKKKPPVGGFVKLKY